MSPTKTNNPPLPVRAKRRDTASFRDPSGFVFHDEGRLLRQVNPIYQPHYDRLMSSGLYDALIKSRQMIAHREIDPASVGAEDAYRVLEPVRVAPITYPYEWAFSQLKAAALCTLKIQRKALQHDMTLKDASAYNIQFAAGRPILIDTLSFENYEEGRPWVAYRQFCQHFLAPLALMSYEDIRLGLLLRDFIDGIPLELASRLLPRRTLLNFNIAAHIHAHAAAQSQARAAQPSTNARFRQLGKQQLLALIEGLTGSVESLRWEPSKTNWADYYQGDSYSPAGLEHKQKLVAEYLAETGAGTVLDLGANTGLYSRIAAGQGRATLSTDSDPGAVELNYREMVGQKLTNITPMLIDLTNPSPGIGWNGAERRPFAERCAADCILALALVHHLAITNNVPLGDIAAMTAGLAEWLIIEFVPKSDPKTQTLLATRQDIFTDYTAEGFEAAFSAGYQIVRSQPITDSDRRLYLMRRKA